MNAGVLLVADHTGGRVASDDASVVARSAAAALEIARRVRPVAALVHADLPPDGGLVLAGRLRTAGVVVVLCLAEADATRLAAALRVGVRAIVDAGAPAPVVAAALDAAADGALFLAPALRRAWSDLLATGQRDPFPGLSVRECEVLELLAGGAARRRIAARLGLSPKTVGHHLAAVRAELGVLDDAEAARLARRSGLGLAG